MTSVTIITPELVVSAGKVLPCPRLSKWRLQCELWGKPPDCLVPFPAPVYPRQDNQWQWGWTDSLNAGWAIRCWLEFANSNRDHILAAQQACQEVIDSMFTKKPNA